jgi:diaminopimelate epimerase
LGLNYKKVEQAPRRPPARRLGGMTFPWLKGHGTENDFVLLPDHDGTIHGDLDPAFVAALCHRRRGIGADGVMRVIRTAALGAESAGEWFMDYRNADGSLSEMCGNGIRVFALHLVQEGLVDPAASARSPRTEIRGRRRTLEQVTPTPLPSSTGWATPAAC